MASKIRLLLVDVDGTLLPGSMERIFFRYLRQHGYIGWGRASLNVLMILLKSGWPRWHNFKVAYLRGLAVDVVANAARECYTKEISPLLWPSMAKSLTSLRERGIELALISGTLGFLAVRLAESLGIEVFAASVPLSESGRYTGGLVEPHPFGKRKVAFAKRIVSESGIDWDQVGAVADNYRDRYLLKESAAVVVVEPDAELADLARERNWGVVVDPNDEVKTMGVMEGIFLKS